MPANCFLREIKGGAEFTAMWSLSPAFSTSKANHTWGSAQIGTNNICHPCLPCRVCYLSLSSTGLSLLHLEFVASQLWLRRDCFLSPCECFPFPAIVAEPAANPVRGDPVQK